MLLAIQHEWSQRRHINLAENKRRMLYQREGSARKTELPVDVELLPSTTALGRYLATAVWAGRLL
jgi:hypothetical protein